MRRGKSRKGKPFRLFCRKRGGDPAGPPVRRLRARTAGRAGAWAGAFPRRGRYLPADWRGRKSGTAGPVPDFCMGARKNRAGRRRYPQGACRRGGRRAQPPVPVPLQIKTGRAAFLQPGAFSVSVIFSSPFFRVLFFGAAPSAPAPLPAAASKTGRCRSGGRLRPAPACR